MFERIKTWWRIRKARDTEMFNLIKAEVEKKVYGENDEGKV